MKLFYKPKCPIDWITRYYLAFQVKKGAIIIIIIIMTSHLLPILLLLLTRLTSGLELVGPPPANDDEDDDDRIGPSEPGFLPSGALRFAEDPESAVALPGDHVYFSCKTAGGAGGEQ